MPIRTHRGRAAVYRRLWGWPLRSPKHLIFAVVLVVAAASGVGLLLPEPPPSEAVAQARQDDGSDPSRTTTGSSEPSSEETGFASAEPPSISVPSKPPEPAPPDPAGLAVVDAWGRQWVEHPPGTTNGQWLNRLRPYTTDEFITQMTSIDPANVPANAVTGPVTAISSTETAMRVRLPTDAGIVEVRVVDSGQGWRVANYGKAA